MEVKQSTRLKIGYAEDQIWSETVKKEKDFADSWERRWSWVADEYSNMEQELGDLKKYRPRSSQRSTAEIRTVGKFPETTYGEIGWLVTKPEFQLEIYGPYYKKISMEPPNPDELRKAPSRFQLSN